MDALLFCVMYFLHTCRKLFLTSSIYNMNFCTETQSRSCRIHRYVSAADYNYLLRFHDRCVIIIAECLHQVISGQVLICRKYAVGIFTRNTHELRKSGTRTDEDCLETFFIHQFVDCDRFSDNYVCLNLNAQLADILDLRLYNAVLRKTELRNAVGQYSARLMKCLENGYFIAQFCQIACTGQTCRTGTDDCYFLSVCLLRRCRYKTMLTGPVCHEALKFTNGNRLALDTAHTLSLTLGFLWADTSTDCRKCRRKCDDFRCLLNISRFYFLDKRRNIDGNRASSDTFCIFTVQTSLRLRNCFFHIIAETYLFKISRTYLRILLSDRHLFHHISLCFHYLSPPHCPHPP